MIRLLLVNPNSTVEMTERMGLTARALVADQAEIVLRTNTEGPPAIQGSRDGVLAAPGLLQILGSESFNAGVIACFDDTALAAAQEICPVPIVGIGQASFHAACLLARRFAVLTTLPISVPVIEDNLQRYGLAGRCQGVVASGIAVLDLERDPEGSTAHLIEVAEQVLVRLCPDVLVLGCAGMTGMAQSLTAKLGIPVIDPVMAAISLALGLVGLISSDALAEAGRSERLRL
ncbi:MAG: aspartate/glutamate racemase family protein [Cyanophyceae cyanobacterium]